MSDEMENNIGSDQPIDDQIASSSSAGGDDFVSQFGQQLGFDVPAELDSSDKLSQYIQHMSARAGQADDYEHRIAQQSQELTDWRAWQQQQAQQSQQYEAQQTQQQAQQEASAARRWQMQQAVDTRFLETDPRTGMWKAPQGYPELHSKAEEANKSLRQRQEFTEGLYADPYAFTRELVNPALSELEQKLMERISLLEGQIQPVAQRSYETQMQAFEWDNKEILYKDDPANPGQLTWSAAGELYQDYLQLGADPKTAIEMAYQRSYGSQQQQQVAQETTASVKNSWLQKAKAVSRQTGQPTQAAGTVATALRNGDSQTTNKLTGRAKYKQYVQEAEQELSESM